MKIKQKISLAIGMIACLALASCTMTKRDKQPVPLTAKDKIASCLSFATLPDGEIAITWAEKNSNFSNSSFYFAKWDKNKDTFSAPVAVPLEENTSFNEENKPMLVFQSLDSIWAIYSISASTPKNKFSSFVHYRISANGGKSWSQPKSLLNDTVAGLSRSFANAIRLPNGKIAFAWMGGMFDMKEVPGRVLYYTTSTGMGEFSRPILIDSFACPCCRNSLAVSRNGKVAIAYRSVRKGDIRDIAFSYQPIGQDTFTQPIVFSNDRWVINSCPEDGPSLVVTNQSNLVSWFTGGEDKGLYYAELDNQSQVLKKRKIDSTGRSIQLIRTGDNQNTVIYNHTESKGDQMMSQIELLPVKDKMINSTFLSPDSLMATHPVLIPENGGHRLLTAWLSGSRVWYKVVNALK